jgi:hypothetical protein
MDASDPDIRHLSGGQTKGHTREATEARQSSGTVRSGAVIRLYTGYNGTGSVALTLRPADSGGNAASCTNINLTPINSIRLSTT